MRGWEGIGRDVPSCLPAEEEEEGDHNIDAAMRIYTRRRSRGTGRQAGRQVGLNVGIHLIHVCVAPCGRACSR